MPELKALKIGRRQEAPPRSGWREPPPGLEALFEAYDSAMSGMPPRSAAPPVGHGVKDAPADRAEMSKKRGGGRPSQNAVPDGGAMPTSVMASAV